MKELQQQKKLGIFFIYREKKTHLHNLSISLTIENKDDEDKSDGLNDLKIITKYWKFVYAYDE
jgi:hypothetical protein